MTAFQNIYSLFLSQVADYKLRDMFNYDEAIAQEMLKTLLMRSVPKFFNCEQDLTETDYDSGSFSVDLTLQEQVILSELMVEMWLEGIINDTRQINVHLQDNDFTHYSEAENLKQKSEYFDRIREKVRQEMTNYGLYNTDFAKWAEGDYGL